mmetsp:Transcript_118604/g.253184  ORF Transcript_118604/g.253184 Transcript_118604/m.253184 type:complete len:661 (-) Transcript_118604:113-2095(-)
MAGGRSLRSLLLLCAALWRSARADEEEACTAGADGSSSCLSASGRVRSDSSSFNATSSKRQGFAADTLSRADVLTQELEELEALVRHSEARIALLEDLESALRVGGPNLPPMERRALGLLEETPLMSMAASDGEGMPTAASEDFLLSKAKISLPRAASLVKFLPLRDPHLMSQTGDTMRPPPNANVVFPTELLVVVQVNGTVQLFTTTGRSVLTFSAGHTRPIGHLAVSTAQLDYLIATSDTGGVIRVHRVKVRDQPLRRRKRFDDEILDPADDDSLSRFTAMPIMATVQLQRQVEIPAGDGGGIPEITSLALVPEESAKHVVVGDAEGKISVFGKHGAFQGKLEATAIPGHGVRNLHVRDGQVLFSAGIEWGYIHPEEMTVSHVECPEFEGSAVAVVIDPAATSRVYVADEGGSVWIFKIRNKRFCQVDRHFPSGVLRGPNHLASFQGFAFVLETGKGGAMSVALLNASYMEGRRMPDPSSSASMLVWRREHAAAVRAWAVLGRRSFYGTDLIALVSGDGLQVEVFEHLLGPRPPEPVDYWWYFKVGSLITLVVVAIGAGLYKLRKTVRAANEAEKAKRDAEIKKEKEEEEEREKERERDRKMKATAKANRAKRMEQYAKREQQQDLDEKEDDEDDGVPPHYRYGRPHPSSEEDLLYNF